MEFVELCLPQPHSTVTLQDRQQGWQDSHYQASSRRVKTDRLEGLSELDTISECSWSCSRPPHNGPGWIARSDFGDGHDMLTYPLVIHFHPPDPLSVGVVEGLSGQ